MKELTKKELLEIEGGAVTASYINALVKGVEALLELGRSLGTSIHRWLNGNVCL